MYVFDDKILLSDSKFLRDGGCGGCGGRGGGGRKGDCGGGGSKGRGNGAIGIKTSGFFFLLNIRKSAKIAATMAMIANINIHQGKASAVVVSAGMFGITGAVIGVSSMLPRLGLLVFI